jgi:hypothetical protein
MREPVTYDSLAGLTRIEPKTHDERLASIATLVKFIDEQQTGSSMFRLGQLPLTSGVEGGIGYAKPAVTPAQFTLDTRGVFTGWYELANRPFVLGQQGERTFWGLINGKWHLATVHWVVKKFEGVHSPWPHATLVAIGSEISLHELLDMRLPTCDARAIEYWLKEFVKRCYGLAQDRLKPFAAFTAAFDAEEAFWSKVEANAKAAEEVDRRKRIEAHAARRGG